MQKRIPTNLSSWEKLRKSETPPPSPILPGKAASDVKIDIKLSNIKLIHASWIIAAFQQITKF
jgi:hypothetical protein